MKYKKTKNGFLIILEKDEKIIESLTNFCKQQKIKGAKISALGAVLKVDISYYSLKDYKYHSKEFIGEFEVLNITGNVSVVGEKPFCHLHITISENFNAFGGHLNEAIVGPTLEIFLNIEEKLERKYDENVKLKLLNL